MVSNGPAKKHISARVMHRKSKSKKKTSKKMKKKGWGGKRVVCPLVQVDGALDGGGRVLDALPEKTVEGQGGEQGSLKTKRGGRGRVRNKGAVKYLKLGEGNQNNARVCRI